ncbi:MAG TPA: sigma 54-interacting transcriptional regulator [Vicinamibacterales bacterium]|nr:sigma 54-interacting transcriptional regulator [Vicinamibacterales bacterium]
MRFVADRFAMNTTESRGLALDLARAAMVWMEESSATNDEEQQQWVLRCDELFRLRHPAMATLVDYGLIGATRRFEAWACGPAWRGPKAAAAAAERAAAGFLRQDGKSAGHGGAQAFCSQVGPVIVPASDAGYPAGEPDAADDSAPGLALIERPAVVALADMLRTASERRPRVAALWGPCGAGLRTAVIVLAREARVNGFVPVDARLLDTYSALLADRSLFLTEWDPRRRGLTALLRATLRTSRGHVCLVASGEDLRGVDGVGLTPVSVSALVNAIRPRPSTTASARRLERAAIQSRGLPGRFTAALWSIERERRHSTAATVSRVAERPATYADTNCASDGRLSSTGTPAEGDVATLRARVEHASGLLAAGRHSPGLRLLRQTVAALARRQAWPSAAEGGVILARELLARGRPREALRALDELTGRASPDGGLLIDCAVLSANAWIDLARLDEAERVLAAALTSVKAQGDQGWRQPLSTSLARCLFWRGDYADARALVEAGPLDGPAADIVRRHRVVASIAIAQGDSARALASLEAAREVAHAGVDLHLQADVADTSAFVKLVVGDLDGVDREASACLASARLARHPLRAFSSRLLRAEADRRRGRLANGDSLAALRRMAATVPPLVKARWNLLLGLCGSADPGNVTTRHISATGLGALGLFSGSPLWTMSTMSPLGRSGLDPLVDEVIAILNLCQHAEDEVALLTDVCTKVRQHLGAAAVGFAVTAGTDCQMVAFDGPRLETDIAVRGIEAGIAIAPQLTHGRLEAAAPVRYGGAPIGALCARWSIGTTNDLSRAPAVLSMAAAAAAPLVSAVLARRTQTARKGAPDLLGITTQMADLRRSIDRAAAAPFAVLIEGESGSGKELVARGIHRMSTRRDRRFCTLNCAALPDDLVETELFGHARGSFTGAMADRPGVFEEAHGGTLFLDEVGELSPRAQAKVLRVIQEGELRRIGENVARRIDVRIVSATNRDLRREVEAGRFRLDLLYRLDVIRIAVPPLRERREDLALLADHFWSDAINRIGSQATLAAATCAALTAYDWPGNVRELQNVLAALAVRSPKRGVVPPTALPPHVATVRRPASWRLDAARRTFEETFIRAALVRSGGHRGRAAYELGVTRQGLGKLMVRLGISD